MGCWPVEMTLVAPNGAVPLTGISYLPIKLVSTSESNNDGALLPMSYGMITLTKVSIYKRSYIIQAHHYN